MLVKQFDLFIKNNSNDRVIEMNRLKKFLSDELCSNTDYNKRVLITVFHEKDK